MHFVFPLSGGREPSAWLHGLPVALRAGLSALCSQHGNGTNPQGSHSRMTPTLTKPLLSDPDAEFWGCPCAPFREAACVQQGESHYPLLNPPGVYVLCVKPTLSRFPVHLVKPGLWALPGQLIFCGTQGATKPEKPCFSFFNYIHCGSKDKVGITEIIWSKVVLAECFCDELHWVYCQCGAAKSCR